MKTSILLSLGGFALSAAVVFGQGTINVGNGITATRFPIYNLPTSGFPESGNGALSAPTGTTVYTGGLLSGTRYAIEFWAGPASAVDFSGLTLITTMTFRTGASATALPNGITLTINNVPIPGVAPGQQAKLAVRAWDTWSSLSYANAFPRRQGGLFLSAPLGGNTTPNPTLSPNWIGESFAFPPTPEPSSAALVLCGAIAVAVTRLRK